MSETRATISVIRWLREGEDPKVVWDKEFKEDLEDMKLENWGDDDDPEWEFSGSLRVKDKDLPWDELMVEYAYHHKTKRHGFEFMIEPDNMYLYVSGEMLTKLKGYVEMETKADLDMLDTLAYVWYDGCDRP